VEKYQLFASVFHLPHVFHNFILISETSRFSNLPDPKNKKSGEKQKGTTNITFRNLLTVVCEFSV
jgi:hypothetical protein